MSRRIALVLAFLVAALASAVAADVPSPLEKLSARKVKGTPAEVLAQIGDRESRLDCGAFGANGKYLAMGGPGDSILVWDFPDLRKVATLKNKETVCLAFSPNGKMLAAGDSGGVVKVWKVASGLFTPLATLPTAHKDGPVWSMAFFPDGNTLATGGSDSMIKLWDVTKAKPTLKTTLTGHKSQVRGLAISGDGSTLASAGWKDESVKVWDVAADKPTSTDTHVYKALVTGVSFAADVNKLAVSVADGKVRVYDVEEGKLKDEKVISAKKDKVAAVAFNPTGDAVTAIVYWDANEDRIFVYDLDGKAKYEGGYGQRIQGLVAAPDGRHLAAVHERNASLVRLPAEKAKK